MSAERICGAEGCGKTLEGRRHNTLYCDSVCREVARAARFRSPYVDGTRPRSGNGHS